MLRYSLSGLLLTVALALFVSPLAAQDVVEDVDGTPPDAPPAADTQAVDTPVPPTEPSPSEEEFSDAPLPPVLPTPMESGESLEPEVTIIRREDATIEEYRINGRMYMVKVTPVVGEPYYLVDRNGDGRMEARMSEIYEDFVVPQWVLFSW